MPKSTSPTFAGRAGDASSIDNVTEATQSAIDKAPIEALLTDKIEHVDEMPSAWADLKSLGRDMIKQGTAKRIFMLLGFLVFVLLLNVVGEIRMNRWQGSFYRAIEHKDLSSIGHESLVFLAIVAILLTLVISQNWLVERLKIRIREWFSHRLLDEWMAPARAYRLNMASQEKLNPDQRIQEDVRNFSEMSADLGLGAGRSTFMLISFVGVLWGMSAGVHFTVGERTFEIPGYMVLFALAYAALGSFLTSLVGGPLIRLNEERYSREAGFRYSLVRVSDSAESIAFYQGEKDERKIVNGALGGVLSTMKKLSFANARLTWITCGHGWMVVILPVLVALPGYIQGKLDFGGLMMVVGAFNQVQQSLRWFVENFARIADWRTALHRVVVFRDAVTTVDDFENQPQTIETTEHPEGRLAFEGTGISLIDGEVVIADATAEIMPGERILLVGESGSGKSTLFRAVAGLWPWGHGKIKLPPKNEIMFLPQKPYMPLGTLASALAYPNAAGEWKREDMEAALTRANLEEFGPLLDKTERWDKAMSLGQQQRLAFARLLLHKPKWIFLDEATSALDDDNQERMMSIFLDELKDSALLSIGHRQGLDQYHTRMLHLNETHTGRVLQKRPVETKMKKKKGKFRTKLNYALRTATATR